MMLALLLLHFKILLLCLIRQVGHLNVYMKSVVSLSVLRSTLLKWRFFFQFPFNSLFCLKLRVSCLQLYRLCSKLRVFFRMLSLFRQRHRVQFTYQDSSVFHSSQLLTSSSWTCQSVQISNVHLAETLSDQGSLSLSKLMLTRCAFALMQQAVSKKYVSP